MAWSFLPVMKRSTVYDFRVCWNDNGNEFFSLKDSANFNREVVHPNQVEPSPLLALTPKLNQDVEPQDREHLDKSHRYPSSPAPTYTRKPTTDPAASNLS